MKLLAFGEILWDVYGEQKCIGGAPFNFAAHAVKQGATADIVTSVANDLLGKETLEIIKEYGVGTKFVNISKFETGVCNVTLDNNGTPSYNLVEPVAYDDISLSEEQIDEIHSFKYNCLYYGSLALRESKSYETLSEILQKNHFDEVVCDVNIRQNYYSESILRFAIGNATILKISREEFTKVSNSLFKDNITDYEAFAQQMFCSFDRLNSIIFTLDKNGAMLFKRNKEAIISELPVNKVVSTVGAGDSFIATYIVSRYNGYSLKESIDRSVKISDYVVTKKEAIPEYDTCILLG